MVDNNLTGSCTYFNSLEGNTYWYSARLKCITVFIALEKFILFKTSDVIPVSLSLPVCFQLDKE